MCNSTSTYNHRQTDRQTDRQLYIKPVTILTNVQVSTTTDRQTFHYIYNHLQYGLSNSTCNYKQTIMKALKVLNPRRSYPQINDCLHMQALTT